ncbi:hypothetical protein [Raoultella terrigena]|uniref:hypothetical protein n=1 Tax=Raoultella terrigena TaxID=577 RepID=UPI000975725D|nr:hypothetical protein [Raoultella terrigena]OMP92711.1 hypothetical protein BZP36_17635 [Raoultella terrigena]
MDKAYEEYFEALSEGEEALSYAEFVKALSPANNPDVKFNGMVTDEHGEELAEFSGVYVF